MRAAATPWGRLRRICGAALWCAAAIGLAWYATRLGLGADAALALAVAAGLAIGLRISRQWVALAVLPLIAFSVGGLVLSTQFSNTHATGGGDWSDAAQVAFGGVWFGAIATGVVLVTWVARPGLGGVVARRTRRP